LDHYSIVDPSLANSVQASSSPGAAHFPGDDGGKSLAEMAQRDLEAALQLLAERAQYITGASGAAIALLEGDEMICRASAGPSAPALGAEVQVKTGLTGESVRTRQVLRCDDAETDPRVNRESCRSLGIRSVMVMPLVHEQEVLGVFELMADRPQAFEERDITAMERLAEMVLTGVEHADAAKRALSEITAKNEEAVRRQKESDLASALKEDSKEEEEKESIPEPVRAHSASEEPGAIKTVEPDPQSPTLGKIRKCEGCGFPVSEGRTLCVDCDIARISGESTEPLDSSAAPVFLSQFGAQGPEKNWLQAHFYTIGTILMVALTLVFLALRLR
jgi:putative methionine-R-sulfoxide reductase with GAF domain